MFRKKAETGQPALFRKNSDRQAAALEGKKSVFPKKTAGSLPVKSPDTSPGKRRYGR